MKKSLLPLLFAALTVIAPAAATAVDDTVAGDLIIEPPTLNNAGFEWYISGDDNRNAAVEISFREKGAGGEFRKGLPLLRLHRERVLYSRERGVYINYEAPNMFAGSIFGLEPGTTYECRLVMTDPDGVAHPERTVFVTTRPEPKIFEGGRTLHVYPPGFDGPKEEPAFSSIMEAYYGIGKGMWGSADILPGDVILVHAGVYKADRFTYYEPLGLHFHSAYYLTRNGTPDRPIVIKAAGDGEAILDGAGCYRLIDVMFGDYTWIEGLTITNCDVGVYAGHRHMDGADGIVVKNCKFENVGCAVFAQYIGSENFYIADNTILGRHERDKLYGWAGNWRRLGLKADISSFIAIDINGRGHVVCHNYIAYFHDAIDVTEQGAPESSALEMRACSIDINNNDLHLCSDDFIEADCGVHNIRVYENRGINAAQHGLSAQPIYGGPAYFIRNIVYHVPPGGAFKFNIYPAGVYVFHNTLCAEWGTSPPYSNVHVMNNLFLGTDYKDRLILRASTYTSYTTFDYNGYRLNRNSKNQFSWQGPGEGRLVDYELKEDAFSGSFESLEAFRRATGREEHGITVDYDIFMNVGKPDPDDPTHVYFADEFDFRLKQNAAAVDRGVVLPNINDGFTGAAPDLGALEAGKPVPVYGPRKR